MKNTLRLLAIIASTSLAALEASGAPNEAPTKMKAETEAVVASCLSDWGGFEKALNKFHDRAKQELRDIPAAELTKRLDSEDPFLVMVSLHWPSDLSEKYSSWSAFKSCSERNFKVRKALADSSASVASRNKEIELLDSCFHVVYYKDHVPKPLDQLLECYKKQAKR